MADKQIHELDPVRESAIGGLPGIPELYEDSLLAVEQQGEARHMTGKQFADFAVEAVKPLALDASGQADRARQEADRAQDLRESMELDYAYIDTARREAQESAAEAAGSAGKASASEKAAKAEAEAAAGSASAAKASEANAKKSEDGAKAAQTAAAASEINAKESAAGAGGSMAAAASSASAAAGSASAASKSATDAAESAKSVAGMAKTSQSYAVGGTGTRQGEDADNAAYYYEQAKRISQGLAGALLPMGTVPFAGLATVTRQAGYMYNLSDAFTTDASFKEGPGHAYPAGTNVYYTADGAWDCLAGAQVVSVAGRTGAVTLSKADVGLENVNNTADSVKSVASAKTADTAATLSSVLPVSKGGTGVTALEGSGSLLQKLFPANKAGVTTGRYMLTIGPNYDDGGWVGVGRVKELLGITAADVDALPSGGKAGTAGTADKVAHALSFTGGASVSYDGSVARSVAIPAASSTAPKAPAASASAGSETAFARGDHVHPVQTSVTGSSGSCTGNAATATTLSATLPVAKGGTGATAAASALSNLGGQPKHKTLSLTLAAATWSASNTYTVTATGVTASNTVIVSPAPASYAAWGEAGVRCTAQGANSLTFTAADKPGAALTAQVLILD